VNKDTAILYKNTTEIAIFTKQQEYKRPVSHLTAIEMDWIARELSEWWGMEITVEAK
jgi:hypothetical protein